VIQPCIHLDSCQAYLTVFTDGSLCEHPHVRNRTLGLRIELSLRKGRLAPALAEEVAFGCGLLYSSLTLAKVSLQLLNGIELAEPRSGVFEPALALFLVKSEVTFRGLLAESGRWLTGKKGSGRSAAFEWLGKRGSWEVQVLDNLRFDASCNEVAFWVPTGDVRHAQLPVSSEQDEEGLVAPRQPPLCQCQLLVLVDIQRFAVLSHPIEVQAFLAAGVSQAPEAKSCAQEAERPRKKLSAKRRPPGGKSVRKKRKRVLAAS